MCDATPPGETFNNRILNAMPREIQARLWPGMDLVHLNQMHIINLPGEQVRIIYFPTGAVVGAFLRLLDGSTVEVSAVGNEGMVGVSALLGRGTMPFDTTVLIPGSAYAVRTDHVAEAFYSNDAVRHLLLRYLQTCLTSLSYMAGCNRHHLLEPRMATCLLTLLDRTTVRPFPLTHDFLADVLGFGRPSVTRAAFHLQEAGFIQYKRGHVSVVNRCGLEDTACECYELVRNEYRQLAP